MASGQFWADGFWSAGFWADGFWGEAQSQVREVEIRFKWWSRKVRKVVAKVARKVIARPQVKQAPNIAPSLQEAPQPIDYTAELVSALAQENIAWNRFYSDLLAQQIEAQRLFMIRAEFERMGLYRQIEEEDERALMLLFMEL